ncbi:MAG: RNA-binding transcriptional accessory protein [Candidatus Lokiarchaeota archaeon]|nr:RNA-binding transcriptional accessory protein [Candidatus Lokiarchaeota archaeon]
MQLQIDTSNIIRQIASKLQLRPTYISNAISLMAEGGTVPFIARYRKEQTGAMTENELREIKDSYEDSYKREELRIQVLKSIHLQDKLTPELKQKILTAKTLTEIEDLYLPYKPKRKTLATKALEKGLGPLAEIIREERLDGDREEILNRFVNEKKGVKDTKEALKGAIDIIAEDIGNHADFRKYVREVCFERSTIISKVVKKYEHLLKEKQEKEEDADAAVLQEMIQKRDELERQGEKGEGEQTNSVQETASKTEEEVDLSSHDSIKALIRKQMEEQRKKEEERQKKLQEDLLRKQKKELKAAGLIDDIEGGTLGKKEADPLVFEMYFDFSQSSKEIPPHRILAMNRGEEEKVLTISLEHPDEELINYMLKETIKEDISLFKEEYVKAVDYGFKRYIIRAIDREIRSDLTQKAEVHAISVFAKNLESLLMQPPIKGKKIIGIDPGYRTGCKVAIINEFGNFLEDTVIYPTPPKSAIAQSKQIIAELVNKHKAYTIAIGNGTASRETEDFIAALVNIEKRLEYAIVSEAGASVYSASELAYEEFPKLDATVRGAISIARRLQDPLSELIKIDPKSIGVGLYQHDVNQATLKKQLDAVIEDCVNKVGVLVNNASYKLLEYVSGLGTRLARQIFEHRNDKGPFRNREELKKVTGLGDKAFEQCAGFLKVLDGTNPLDGTNIHPESYWVVEKILEFIGEDFKILNDPSRKKELAEKIKQLRPKELMQYLRQDIGLPTLKDIVMGLIRPDRDPRDDLPQPILRKDIKKLEDLKEGEILKGTVRNVVDFGAFIDIGVKYDGLVHISQMTHKDGDSRYISNPLEVLNVGDIIDVKVIKINLKTNRIQLSMKLDDTLEGRSVKSKTFAQDQLRGEAAFGGVVVRKSKQKK